MPESGEYAKYYEMMPQGQNRRMFRPAWGHFDFEDSFKTDMRSLIPFVDTVISTDTNHRHWQEMAGIAQGLVQEIASLATNFTTKVINPSVWEDPDPMKFYREHSELEFDLGGKRRHYDFYHHDMTYEGFTSEPYAMVFFDQPASWDAQQVMETAVLSNSMKANEFHNRILLAIQKDGLLQSSYKMLSHLFKGLDGEALGFELLMKDDYNQKAILQKKQLMTMEDIQRIRHEGK